jgi:sugar phosphate isomerase/epimerase
MADRRLFLKASAGTVLGGLYLAASGCAGDDPGQAEAGADDAAGAAADTTTRARAGIARIGVQLYTVRDQMERDVAGTIAQVARLGYDEVEFAGYYDTEPAQVRALLDRVGLAAPAAHIGYEQLQNDLDATIAVAKAIGHRYLVVSYLAEAQRGGLDAYRRHAAFFNQAGQRLRDEGLRLAYHNHDFEFETFDGRAAYDVLLEETDAGLVDMELDLYWITYAGQDPLAYFERYPGRFKLFHVKDMRDRAGAKTMAPVGEGELDFATLLARAQAQGGEHFFVEQDNAAEAGGSLESIAKSYRHLSSLALRG